MDVVLGVARYGSDDLETRVETILLWIVISDLRAKE